MATCLFEFGADPFKRHQADQKSSFKLKPLRDATLAVIDHDGWSLDHFIYQSANGTTTQLTGALALKPTRTPTGLLVPPMWLPPNTKVEAIVDIAPSRLQASFARE